MIEIEENDHNQLIELGDKRGDVLLAAEELGYTIDKNFVIDMIRQGIHIRRAFGQSFIIHLQPDEAEGTTVPSRMRKKIHELYGDDMYQLMAISNRYTNKGSRLMKPHPSYVNKHSNMKQYYIVIAKGIGLLNCTSFDQIDNFKLSDEDEEIRKAFSD
jgi:hypothetical protein